MQEYREVPIKSYTKAEIASMYGITTKTLRVWLIKVGVYHQLKDNHVLNAYQVRLIFEKLGRVEKIIEK